MKTILSLILIFLCTDTFSQRTVSTVSVSHYPNAELYLKADVVCRITDASGKPSASGTYLSIENRGQHNFIYSFSAANNAAQSIAPGKKVRVPIKSKGSFRFVPVNVKYMPAQKAGYERMKELRRIHAETDELVMNQSSRQATKTSPLKKVTPPRTRVEPVDKATAQKKTFKDIDKGLKQPKQIATKSARMEGVAGHTSETLPDSLKCLSTANPSYHTFYYLKVRNTVLYSNVFAVPEYTNEEEGLDLLEQAWLCFVPALRSHFSEKEMDEMLNDNDNDLQLGLLHLRDPFIPSATIAERYPYTQSFNAAQTELRSWIASEKLEFPRLRFVKVEF